jgi:hypothetical protein
LYVVESYPAIADSILEHGDKKKSLQSLYLTIGDQDLLDAIARMKFDSGETEIWVTERGNGRFLTAMQMWSTLLTFIAITSFP